MFDREDAVVAMQLMGWAVIFVVVVIVLAVAAGLAVVAFEWTRGLA